MIGILAIAFLILGALLIVIALLIYFRADDCRKIIQELKGAKHITTSISYGSERELQKRNRRTGFAYLNNKEEETTNFEESKEKRFVRGAEREAQDDTAFLATFSVSEQKQNLCDTEPLNEGDTEALEGKLEHFTKD